MEIIKPKKSLGQNFLIDKNISSKIVDTLCINDSDYVLEIGPGTGALTKLLLNNNINLFSIEIDKRAVSVLDYTFPADLHPNFNLIHEDICNIDLKLLPIENNKKWKIIGNIPYNITANIIFWMISNAGLINIATLMVQKEVAKRIIADYGNKDYGILSIACQLSSKVKICFNVSANCFYPKPKVDSAIIQFDFNKTKYTDYDFNKTMTVVKNAFNQRRKILNNSLKQLIESKNNTTIKDFTSLLDSEIQKLFTKRPEELKIEQFILLQKLIMGE